MKFQKYLIIIKAYGNEDFGENPNEFMCEPLVYFSDDIEMLQNAVRNYISKNNLGSGNIPPVKVYLTDGFEHVAYISYNGRFTDKKEFEEKWGCFK